MPPRCVLSGSYRRDYAGLEQLYRELANNGCQILSPHRLHFIYPNAAFVKDTAETNMSVESIETHHLLAISQSDFVWLHCPNGYIGVSTAMEIGYAYAKGIPVFSKTKPAEEVFALFITLVPSVFMALEQLRSDVT